MILAEIKKDPQKTIPIAMMFIVVGLMLITTSNLLAPHSLPAGHPGTDWGDFTHGVMIGMGIVFEIAGLVLALSASNRRKKQL